MNEQLYIFIDKTGHCFEDFQSLKVNDECHSHYNDCVGAMLRGGEKFTVGDMLAFKDDLVNAGFEWGTDFYVRKVNA